MKKIPVQFVYPVMALRPTDAATALSVSPRTVSRLIASGKLPKTSYGVIPVSALEAHLRNEAYER